MKATPTEWKDGKWIYYTDLDPFAVSNNPLPTEAGACHCHTGCRCTAGSLTTDTTPSATGSHRGITLAFLRISEAKEGERPARAHTTCALLNEPV